MPDVPHRPIAHVYVDGFNLYYGALKAQPHLKWLNLRTWSDGLLKNFDVARIVYCTAMVQSNGVSQSRSRQDKYVRALGAVDVEVLKGTFQFKPTKARRTPGGVCLGGCGRSTAKCECGSNQIQVTKPEEKGSDVNLAVQLVADALRGRMQAALVVSGDSDLQSAVDVARGEGVSVWVADPRDRNSLVGDQKRQVRPAALVRAQFPDKVTLSTGGYVLRPREWPKSKAPGY